jgi:hypothetical protein
MAAAVASGLALAAAFDAIIGQMRDQWPGIAITGNRTAGGLIDGEGE